MTSAEELWEWIGTPLDELKRDFNDEPDKPWDTRRTEFLERLGLRDPDEHPMVGELFERFDQMGDDDRTNVINSGEIDSAAYELTRQHGVAQEAGQEQAPAESAYDEQAWQAFLTEKGPAWDGTEQSWAQFSQWFLYYAGERGLTEPATALVEYLNSQPAAERITTFAQYGVTITPAAGGASDDDLHSVMADILAEKPDLAAIPEERRRQLLAEVFGHAVTTSRDE